MYSILNRFAFLHFGDRHRFTAFLPIERVRTNTDGPSNFSWAECVKILREHGAPEE